MDTCAVFLARFFFAALCLFMRDFGLSSLKKMLTTGIDGQRDIASRFSLSVSAAP